MIQLLINGKPTQIGPNLPDKIDTLVIRSSPLPKEQALMIKKWLNLLVSKLTCTHVMYDMVIIPVTDLKLFDIK